MSRATTQIAAVADLPATWLDYSDIRKIRRKLTRGVFDPHAAAAIVQLLSGIHEILIEVERCQQRLTIATRTEGEHGER